MSYILAFTTKNKTIAKDNQMTNFSLINFFKKFNNNFLKKRIFLFGLMILPVSSAGAGINLYVNSDKNIEPVILNDEIIGFEEEISIKFDHSINDYQEYQDNISIYPNNQLLFTWSDDKTALIIKPQVIWNPETEYTISLPQLNHESQLSHLFSFTTVGYPQIINTNPKEGFKGVPFNEDNPISIQFDKSVDSFDMQAVVRPFVNISQKYDKNSRTLTIIPQEEIDNYGSHTITVFMKHKAQSETDLYPVGNLTFDTLLPIPDEWPEQHQARLLIARQSTIPKIKDGKYIDVNLDAQITTLFEDGKFIENFVSSTGASDTPTPTGTFQIYNKHPYALSNMFQVYLPYWLAFTPDGLYGLHGLIVWPKGHKDMPNGGKESQSHIGNAVSAGCVRHDAINSKKLYEWAEIGTQVVIY
jgi:hypothetical protein